MPDEDDGNNDQENLHLWEDLLGKTWERREKPSFKSKWKTMELMRDGTLVIEEGVKREVKDTDEKCWQITDNTDFWGSKKGNLIVVGSRNAKPLEYWSLEKFKKKFGKEKDPKMH